MSSHVCEGMCRKRATRLTKREKRIQGRVMFSKNDGQYLCAFCRGPNPRARRKRPENRWFMQPDTKVQTLARMAKTRRRYMSNRDKLEEFVLQFRASKRPLMSMTVKEFTEFTGLATATFFEEARELVRKGLHP